MTPASRHRSAADSSSAVDPFMAELPPETRRLVEALRRCLLGVGPAVAEGIKWNAPSFRTRADFATLNLRQKDGLGLILHLGAKARELPQDGLRIDDPQRQLRWLARDRAMLVFKDLQDLEQRRPAVEELLRSWIAWV